MSQAHQRLYDLDATQCRERLRTHHPRIGRIAFAEGGDPMWPTVMPVNYTYRDGYVYLRTVEGSKLYAVLRGQRVAFEIDEVDESWQEGWSVVAVGRLRLVDDDQEREAVDRELRTWVPEASHLVRLDIVQITGRELIGGAAP